MINIAVCEDDNIQLKIIANYIKKWSTNKGIQANIETFSSAESFLFECSDTSHYDIVFLDIEMKTISGLELAENIRLNNSDVNIVFITGNSKYALQGYKVKALNYILKPIKEDEINDCLNYTYEKLNKSLTVSSFITLEMPKQNIRINCDDILYCIMFSPYIDICMKNNKLTIRKKISEIEKLLPYKSFIRCHRSYLVNIKYITSITKNYVTLENNLQIPISRGSYNKVNEAFLNYLKKTESKE